VWALATLSFEQVILVVALILVVLDAVFLMAVLARFKRSRLVLSQ